MNKEQREQIAAIVYDMQKSYNVEVDNATRFGRMMSQYSDSSMFFLDACAEALEEWNDHRASALCRRVSSGYINVNAALCSGELLEVLKLAAMYLHNADRELKSGKTLRQIVSGAIDKSEGKDKEWEYWKS